MKTLVINGLGDLPKAAQMLIEASEKSSVVALYGAMGVGKTTLVREVCLQLGVEDNVTSPTFALVNEYRGEGERTVFHFDFYRINRLEEVYDMGYEEYFYSGDLCLIEWPEMIEELLPDDVLKVRLELYGDNSV